MKYLLTVLILITSTGYAQDHLQHCRNLQLETHLHSLKACVHEVEGRVSAEQYMRMIHHIRSCEVLIYIDSDCCSEGGF